MRDVRDFPPIDEERLQFRDRLRFLLHGRAYKRRFAARARQHGIVFSSPQPSHQLLFAFAAASFAMLIAMLSIAGWLGGQLHEARIRNQAMAADLRALRQRSGQPLAAQALPPAGVPPTTQRAPEVRPEVRIVGENPDEGALPARPAPEQPRPGLEPPRADLERAQADLEQSRAGSRDLGGQLQHAREQIESLGSEMAGSKIVETHLSDQLRESELRLSGMTAELTRLQAGHSADTDLVAAQRLRLRDLTDQLNAKTNTIDRERKMLVADLDIRDLMGARSLHIVDVFDVDGKGKTQRPFGRVFYTEGKSLIFYAFDLKGGATFQAWGQREARDESAQSLGLFYIDDQKQNRWILKFEDPKVLAEINAVFVTVEPPGGSVKPNRQKMLYAYLNATPNHP
jgi:hypothetical protein